MSANPEDLNSADVRRDIDRLEGKTIFWTGAYAVAGVAAYAFSYVGIDFLTLGTQDMGDLAVLAAVPTSVYLGFGAFGLSKVIDEARHDIGLNRDMLAAIEQRKAAEARAFKGELPPAPPGPPALRVIPPPQGLEN